MGRIELHQLEHKTFFLTLKNNQLELWWFCLYLMEFLTLNHPLVGVCTVL
jgi:hypothetical protein